MSKAENRSGSPQNPPESGKHFTRRLMLKRAAQAFGGIIATDQISRVLELTDTESKVKIVPGQERRFLSDSYNSVRNGVLVLGGATVQDSTNIAKAITPGLEALGPVLSIDWSNTGFDMKSVARDLDRLQRRYGMENLSLYFHSMGDIEAGMLMSFIGNRFHIPMMIFDDSLVDLSDVKLGILREPTELAADIPFSPLGYSLTEGVNIFYYHNPFNTGAATPDLSWAQLRAAKNGRKNLAPLAATAKRDGSVVILLQPGDPKKDPIINDGKAESDLKSLFPNLQEDHLTGDSGHANELQHPGVYIAALRQVILQTERRVNLFPVARNG